MRAILEVLGIALLAGLILTVYDGAGVGEYRWQNPKALVYSVVTGAGFVLAPYVALLALSYPIKFFAKKTWSAHRFAIVAATLIAAFLLWGGFYGSTHALREPSLANRGTYDSAPSIETAEVIAAITSQSSGGVTTSDFDQTTLKNLETWFVQMTIEKGKNRFEDLGYDRKDFDPKYIASSVYLDIEDKKLAIIKIRSANAMRAVAIIGIERGELVRVTCFRQSSRDIAIFSGECGARVQEAFGVSIKPR